MDNRHKKITKIKAVGSTLDELIEEVEYTNLSTGKRSALDELAEPDMWAHQAKINLKIGLMALTRAVAKPMSF